MGLKARWTNPKKTRLPFKNWRQVRFWSDGWLLIAELDGNNSDAVLSTYTWGLDVSGTTHLNWGSTITATGALAMKKLGIVSIVFVLTMIFNDCLHGSALGDIQESIWKQYISAIQEVVNLEGAEKLEGYESIAGQIGLFIAHLTSCSNDHVTVEDSLIMSDRVLVRVFYSGIIGNFGLHMCLVQS